MFPFESKALDNEVKIHAKRPLGVNYTIGSSRATKSSPEKRRLFDAVLESESDESDVELARSSSRDSRRSAPLRKRRSVSRPAGRSVRGKGARRRTRSKVRSRRSGTRQKVTSRRRSLGRKSVAGKERSQMATATKVRSLRRTKPKVKSKKTVKKGVANKENTSKRLNHVQPRGVSQVGFQ